MQAIGYEAWLYDNEEPRAAETRWNNVQDFLRWLKKRGEEDEKQRQQPRDEVENTHPGRLAGGNERRVNRG